MIDLLMVHTVVVVSLVASISINLTVKGGNITLFTLPKFCDKCSFDFSHIQWFVYDEPHSI